MSVCVCARINMCVFTFPKLADFEGRRQKTTRLVRPASHPNSLSSPLAPAARCSPHEPTPTPQPAPARSGPHPASPRLASVAPRGRRPEAAPPRPLPARPARLGSALRRVRGALTWCRPRRQPLPAGGRARVPAPPPPPPPAPRSAAQLSPQRRRPLPGLGQAAPAVSRRGGRAGSGRGGGGRSLPRGAGAAVPRCGGDPTLSSTKPCAPWKDVGFLLFLSCA